MDNDEIIVAGTFEGDRGDLIAQGSYDIILLKYNKNHMNGLSTRELLMHLTTFILSRVQMEISLWNSLIVDLRNLSMISNNVEIVI